MSLMNDALRKKKGEEKHPSKADFFQGRSKRKMNRGFKIAGIALLAVLLIVAAGYYAWEYVSLSAPAIVPAGIAPNLDENHAAGQEPDSGGYEQGHPASSEIIADSIVHPEEQPDIAAVTLAAVKQEESPESAQPSAPKTVLPENPVNNNLVVASKKNPPPIISRKPACPEPELQHQEIDKTDTDQPEAPEKDDMNSSAHLTPAEALFYQKAVSYHRDNHLEKAIQMYEAVLKQNPSHRPTLFNLASAYIKVSAYPKAHSILETLNEQDPDNPEILLNLAIADIGLGRFDSAMELLDRAEHLFKAPTFELYFHKGVVCSRNKYYEKAIEWYAISEKLQPDNAYMLCNTAIAYDHLGQYNDALNYYRALLKTENPFTRTDKQRIENRIRELARYVAMNPAGETNSKGSAE